MGNREHPERESIDARLLRPLGTALAEFDPGPAASSERR
jgi:hypothetical protein